MTTKPLDFLVIGAAKSGTTTLFYYLRSHPGIYMPSCKEAPFFSNDKCFARGWDHFVREYYSQAPAPSLWGKITPRYMGDVRVPERLSRAMPRARLIALLRNPIDRAFSKYRLLVRKRVEDRTFREVVMDQLSDEALHKARTTHLPLRDSLIARGEYARILKDFLSYFPREQLLVHLTDDLEERPQYVLDSILEFLGLEPGWSPENIGQKYYVGGEQHRTSWLIPVARRIAPLRWVWRAIPRNRRMAFHLWFTREANVVREPPKEMPPDVRDRLRDFYRDDVFELEKLIGRPAPWSEFRETAKIERG